MYSTMITTAPSSIGELARDFIYTQVYMQPLPWLSSPTIVPVLLSSSPITTLFLSPLCPKPNRAGLFMGASSWVLGFLLPSLWEAEVAISAAAVLAAVFLLLLESSSSASSTCHTKGKELAIVGLESKAKSGFPTEDSPRTTYVIKMELLSAKYLIGANLNGTSDPYAIISCGAQKRFSSMVPSRRNPLWGEEFNFLVNHLPVEISITIYDWDNVCKCKVLGSVTIVVVGQDQTGAIWYDLDSKSGQICLRISSSEMSPTHASLLTDFAGAESQRRVLLDKQQSAIAQEGTGPLQALFKLPQDEVVHHSYSCALERSLLHHGRIYISPWHLCFHSNVFSKQLKIKRSQHSLINPAITIILHAGAGGHGSFPVFSRNGRVRYKFTSFWNRNRTFRALETALKNYQATLEAEKQARAHSLLYAVSNNVVSSKTDEVKHQEEKVEQARTFQAFINDQVLVDVTSNIFPSTAEKFFNTVLRDDSKFFHEYRAARKDTDLKLNKWYVSDDYGGQIREVTFKSLCHSPLCPPDTAVTEWQHAVFSKDRRNLVYETKQLAHDVPFGSYFEIHCRWSLRTKSNSTSQVHIKIGVHMKKWCILQSKIKSGATDEYRGEVCKILEAARDYIHKAEAASQETDEALRSNSLHF